MICQPAAGDRAMSGEDAKGWGRTGTGREPHGTCPDQGKAAVGDRCPGSRGRTPGLWRRERSRGHRADLHHILAGDKVPARDCR